MRRIVRAPRFERELKEIRTSADPRFDEALTGFEHIVRRIPETGMAVRGQSSSCRSRPFHAAEGSFLVVYSFDREKVVLLTIRRVPSGSFG